MASVHVVLDTSRWDAAASVFLEALALEIQGSLHQHRFTFEHTVTQVQSDIMDEFKAASLRARVQCEVRRVEACLHVTTLTIAEKEPKVGALMLVIASRTSTLGTCQYTYSDDDLPEELRRAVEDRVCTAHERLVREEVTEAQRDLVDRLFAACPKAYMLASAMLGYISPARLDERHPQ